MSSFSTGRDGASGGTEPGSDRRDFPASREPDVFLPADESVGVVLASADVVWQARLREAGRSLGVAVSIAASTRRAEEWLDSGKRVRTAGLRVLLIDQGMKCGDAAALAALAAEQGVCVAILCDSPSPETAGSALRAGASEIFHRGLGADALVLRLGNLLELARRTARKTQRTTRLQRICRRLSDAGRQVGHQMDALWTDVIFAQRELARTMNQATLSHEFGGLIRQELDLEVLLRTTLEYVLGKSGPTNAAVFLPATSGDFSLGAYVNYDCPKETVDILLDHMANVVAPRFEHVRDIAHLTDPREIRDKVAGDAVWIGDSHVVAFACRHQDECLAIFMFFRDSKLPYPEAFINQLRVVRDLFAAQLARVVRIHHRHLPKDKWGALGDPPSDGSDDGMTA